jgi:DNA-binding IclR family transcriptional regulator
LKGARLLDVVAASRSPFSLSELSQALQLPKSSVLSLCTSLTQARLLTRFEDGTYHLGTHLVDLAHAYLSRTDLTQEFGRAWESLHTMPEESAVLAVLDGTDVVYVACRNGSRPFALTYRIGMRLPAHCTASGKALLATMSDERVRQLYKGKKLGRLTGHSRTTLKDLLADLEVARAKGYAVDDEETREGMCCYGAAVFDATGQQGVAAVALSMMKTAGSLRMAELAVKTIHELAELMSHRLGMLPGRN